MQMNAVLKKVHNALCNAVLKIMPSAIRIRLSAEGFGILKFLEFAAKEIKPGERILDAGAGTCPYRYLFAHARYESTDWQNHPAVIHDFTCDLHQIPQPDNTYDSIVCTQVLQHVEYPQQVVKELYRILKPGGNLFLTTNQMLPVVCKPYHFYNFTEYGLRSMFQNAGFRIVFVNPRGGVFWLFSWQLRRLPNYFLQPCLNSPVKSILMAPFYILGTIVFGFFAPLILHPLDWLDSQKEFTLGHAAHCIKDAPNPGGKNAS
jgi:SAM-dependent methyltransferase